MTADNEQLRHNVPTALAQRLAALNSIGGMDWHEWHQAGVLLSELAESALRIRYHGWETDADALLGIAETFFSQALKLLPYDDDQRHAVNCDRALAFARRMRIPGHNLYSSQTIANILEDAIRGLTARPPTAAHTHQLAIAHDFLARTHWWAWLTYGQAQHVDRAWEHETDASDLFSRNAGTSPDDGQAFTSHLIAMALAHSACWSLWVRWQQGMQAFRLAKARHDKHHQIRALTVAVTGNTGERYLRRRRDQPEAIKASIQGAREVAVT